MALEPPGARSDSTVDTNCACTFNDILRNALEFKQKHKLCLHLYCTISTSLYYLAEAQIVPAPLLYYLYKFVLSLRVALEFEQKQKLCLHL